MSGEIKDIGEIRVGPITRIEPVINHLTKQPGKDRSNPDESNKPKDIDQKPHKGLIYIKV